MRVELETRRSRQDGAGGVGGAGGAGGAGGLPIVHNYGHGGSGWTIMHGTALAACDLVALALAPTSRL